MSKIKEIISNIEVWFVKRKELLEKALNKPVFAKLSSEELFNEIYPRWIYLQEFNLLTDKAEEVYNDCCKLMFGYTWIEINQIMNTLGQENILNLNKSNDKKIFLLEKQEREAINYYRKMTKRNRNFSSEVLKLMDL